VRSFSGISAVPQRLADLSDGHVLSELTELLTGHRYIDAASFRRESGNPNWIYRANSLRRLISAIEDYYRLELHLKEDYSNIGIFAACFTQSFHLLFYF
jgi:hypothetical protein